MDPISILSMLKKWLPGTKLLASAGTEMTFILPTVKDADFYGLFKDLEAQARSLGIVSYGISDPHLEEVNVMYLVNILLLCEYLYTCMDFVHNFP